MKRGKKILFTSITAILVLLCLEFAVRLYERHAELLDGNKQTAEIQSPLSFQQLFEKYVVPTDLPGTPMYALVNLDREGQIFECEKPDGQIRIVILGASQAGALALSDSASYVRWLERFLRMRHPKRDIRVIALARTGYASPQLADVARKSLPLIKPDLVLAAFGHNERLDVKAYADRNVLPPQAMAFALKLRRASALARLIAPARPVQLQPLPPDARPLPPLKNAAAWQSFWVGRLEQSLSDIRRETKKSGAMLALCFPPSNWAYVDSREWWWAPHAADDRRLVQGRYFLRYGNPEKALSLLNEYAAQYPGAAAELLSGWAEKAVGNETAACEHLEKVLRLLQTEQNLTPESYFWLGLQANLALGKTEKARELVRGFMAGSSGMTTRQGVIGVAQRDVGLLNESRETLLSARENDMLAIRATFPVRDTLQALARRWGIDYLDADAALAATCADGIPSWDQFIDYCHLNPTGHIRMARILLPMVEKALQLDRGETIDAASIETERVQSLQKRTNDFAEYDRWLGVCDEIWKVSDEQTDDEPCRFEPNPHDPNELCWAANYLLENEPTTAGYDRVLNNYLRALENDAEFFPANQNLQQLEKRYPINRKNHQE